MQAQLWKKSPWVIYKEKSFIFFLLHITLFSDLCDKNHSFSVNIKGSEKVYQQTEAEKHGWSTMALYLSFADSQIHPSGNYSTNLNYNFQEKIINFWEGPAEGGHGNTKH